MAGPRIVGRYLRLVQMRANPLNGNALKSLDEMSDALTHEVWYFARV